ncbi:helix-turn-helix domain-containing protein [Sphingomonas crusticola]|jgi:transcriptional regulator with XRE-family HTH domain|uniref:helix-turn-helix domain-containing protein n=1 Tax=Sphingomonas crusticola TaxID=1697973 RepID=UPI000E25F9E4|nr:XRE family transcriptional regulator [Sphingomonas crusticola]
MAKRRSTLGAVIRELRNSNNWTLREMSERTGIPVSTLSKVEHNRLTLTYDKLQELSARLNIRMSDLFAESDAPPPVASVTARRSLGTRDNAFRVQTANYDYYYLCAELRRKRMIPNITTIRARSLDEFGELVHHAGEEFIYVLKGQIVVHTEFYDPVTLEPGESIYIDSNMGHAYLAGPDCEEAVTLAVMSSADDDLMDSLITMHGER